METIPDRPPKVAGSFSTLALRESKIREFQAPSIKFLKRMRVDKTTSAKCDISNFIQVKRSRVEVAIEELKGGDEDELNDPLTCEVCGVQKTIDTKQALAVCPSCGEASGYQTEDASFRDGVQIQQSYLYKPVNHFRDHLKRVQGKESTSIRPDILEAIRADFLKKIHSDEPDVIAEEIKRFTIDDVRLVLKNMGYSKLYNHAVRIHHLVTGVTPLQLTQEQENELMYLFEIIQAPWERHRPKDRSNLISYTYLLRKFCQLLGYTDLCKHFRPLKSRDKMIFQDEVSCFRFGVILFLSF